jgi:hypothetical protein
VGGCELNSPCSEQGPVAGFCKRSYELSGSIEGREFVDLLSTISTS